MRGFRGAVADREGFMAESIYMTLTPERQFNVLRTMRKVRGFPLESPTGNPDAFVSVCLAFAAEQHLLDAARTGLVEHATVVALEETVADAGGALVDGPSNQGLHSIAGFRAATFVLLEQSLDASQQALVLDALNAQLRNDPPLTLNEFFVRTRRFFGALFGDAPVSLDVFQYSLPSQHWSIVRRRDLPPSHPSLGPAVGDPSPVASPAVFDFRILVHEAITTRLPFEVQAFAKSALDSFWAHQAPRDQGQTALLLSDFLAI
ncbi:MAG: hypothetical protein EBR40_10990 [Proteobacteria bacterium]|nr:hypothetical protein [Pseudomonadota bacterium]